MRAGVAGLIFLSAACTKTATEQQEDRVLFKIGPVYVTKSEMEEKILELGPEYLTYLRTEPGKRTLLDAILKQKLLARVALNRALDKEPHLRTSLIDLKKQQDRAFRLYRESLLIEALIERLRRNELYVGEDEAANYHREHPRLFHVRHILVSDEAAAFGLRKSLAGKKGMLAAEFAYLAKKHSLEKMSAQKGGEIPPFLEGELEENFEAALAALKPGELSAPVKTKMGYHLIMLERVAGVPLDDEIKARCAGILEKRKLEALLDSWKNKYVMEVKDETLRPYFDF